MSHIRQFEQASMLYGDRMVRGITVACGKCPNKAMHPRGSTKTNVGPLQESQRFEKMFTRQGWHIGRRPQDDRCPDCMQKLGVDKPKTPVEPETKPMNVSTDPFANRAPMAQQQHAPEPKAMSREDGRLIFAKIEEVYRDERHGYQNGWSDHKVAADMGVPRAWVEQVRKQFFGPEGGNEEIRQIMTDARALVAEGGRLVQEVLTIGSKLSSLQTRLDRIEKTVGR